MAFNTKEEHAFKKFNNDIKDNILGNIVLLYGEEDYLVRWAADAIRKKIGLNQLDIVSLDEDAEVDDIIESCETFSLFSTNRLVIVNDYLPLKNDKAKGFTSQDIERLIKYIKDINPNSMLLFKSNEINEKTLLFKELSSVSLVYNFTKLDETTLNSFISKEFKKNGCEISKDLIRYLISETGYFNRESEYRLFNLVNDVIKISSFSDDKVITKDNIDKVLVGDEDTFVFNFLDAISNNRKDTAYTMLENILKDSDVFQISGLLINHFELILSVIEMKKEGLNLQEITKKLKIHEFRVKKALAVSDKFTVDRLKTILSKLYELDRNVKTGLLDGQLTLELVLASI